MPELPDPKLTRFLHGNKRSHPCAARGAAEKAAGPGSLQIDCREGKFACPFVAPHHTRNSTTVLLYASLATPARKKKIERPFYNRSTRICKVPFFPGPVVRSMGATVYCRANRESLYFGDPRPAFCVSLAVYFHRLPAGALRHFGVLLLYLTRHFPNSPNFS